MSIGSTPWLHKNSVAVIKLLRYKKSNFLGSHQHMKLYTVVFDLDANICRNFCFDVSICRMYYPLQTEVLNYFLFYDVYYNVYFVICRVVFESLFDKLIVQISNFFDCVKWQIN